MEALAEFAVGLLGDKGALAGGIIGVFIALANVVTMFSPSTGNNKIYNMIMAFLNALSLNIGKNKNADAE